MARLVALFCLVLCMKQEVLSARVLFRIPFIVLTSHLLIFCNTYPSLSASVCICSWKVVASVLLVWWKLCFATAHSNLSNKKPPPAGEGEMTIVVGVMPFE